MSEVLKKPWIRLAKVMGAYKRMMHSETSDGELWSAEDLLKEDELGFGEDLAKEDAFWRVFSEQLSQPVDAGLVRLRGIKGDATGYPTDEHVDIPPGYFTKE